MAPKKRQRQTADEAVQVPKGVIPGLHDVDPLRSWPSSPGSQGDSEDETFASKLAAVVREVQLQLGKQMEIRSKDIELMIKQIDQLKDLIENTVGRAPSNLSPSIEDNLQAIRKRMGHSDDLVVRQFNVGDKSALRAAVVYVDGLVSKDTIHTHVQKPLMIFAEQLTRFPSAVPAPLYLSILKQYVLTISEVEDERELDPTLDAIASGDTALLLDGLPLSIVLGTRGWESRGISEPIAESTIRGPREGFVETLKVNVSQVRRRVRDPNLRVTTMQVGRRTKSDVAVLHIDGIANRGIVREVFQRIQSIDISAVLESGYIEQIIEDHHFSPFPQIQSTERPDKVAANLLEGRVAILVDGTPFALIVPATFEMFYQSPEDYYGRWIISSLLRIIRVIAIGFSLNATALYVALISFHPEMMPTSFAIAVAGGRAGVPVPSIVEALVMETVMEVLREASIRLPKPIGPTIGIVGALVIGEAATRAGLVSPLMVIVVAVASIGSFAVPSYPAAIALRILKFPMIIAAGTFGLYGMMVFIIGMFIHLSSMESFGVPYMSPFAPLNTSDLQDSIVRAPLWMMSRRPQSVEPEDTDRLPHEAEPIRGWFDMKRRMKDRLKHDDGEENADGQDR